MNFYKKSVVFLFLMAAVLFNLSGQEEFSKKQQAMRLTVQDLKLVAEKGDKSGGGGFHLYVRKLPEVNSIMLTETVRTEDGKATNYAYRALEYNPVNGDEIRYLDGKPLESEGAKYSLIDSTVESNKYFEECFHIYIPKQLKYGYDWDRNGIIEIGKGTFINIRCFEKPYGDYNGEFIDNPFVFDLQPPPKKVVKVEPELEYNENAKTKFSEIGDSLLYSQGPDTLIQDIRTILEGVKNKNELDVVFAIDTTGSMKNDMDKLNAELQSMLEEVFADSPDVRLGLLLYRDYGDTYVYRDLPVRLYTFTSNPYVMCKNLKAVKIYGTEGGDLPEAVYEALYASSEFYNWRVLATKKIILIGDAPPHPTPRGLGKYSEDFVMSLIADKKIQLNVILLPEDDE